MNLAPGQNLLHYRLIEKLGAGGMGVVWKALDTTLEREVAVKILPQAFAADADRLARFEREAKLLATLNHPHIAAIYGLHQTEDVRFLAMELVAGQDLSQRLKQGPLPVSEVLPIALQLANALETAHEHGVVHRDFKPANVVLTADGDAKVLDFGLAKAFDTDPAGSSPGVNPTMSPTLTSAGTVAGMILGTVAYMSPEQARAKPVDPRADVWAFGCVLYEMLTGHALFSGETVSDTLAAVLRAEPEWDELPRETPRAVVELLQRCLDRDRRTRLQAIAEARVTLDRTLADPQAPTLATPEAVVAAVPTAEAPGGRWLPWAVAGALAITTLVAGVAAWRGPGAMPGPRLQTEILPPNDVRFDIVEASIGSVTISPDGRYVTFAEKRPGAPARLWLRPLDGSPPQVLAGTEDSRFPFWSPDSRHIAFFSDGKLKRIDLVGSPAVTICDAPNGRDGSWNADGKIIFSPSTTVSIHIVSAGGGEPEPVTEIDESAGETTHRWAKFLPGGKSFIFMAGGHGQQLTAESHAIWAQSIGSPERTLLVRARSNAVFADGHLLYVRDRVLLAQPFDPNKLEFIGDPRPIAEGLVYETGYFRADFTAAAGMVAYRRGEAFDGSELRWVDLPDGTLQDELVGTPARYEEIAFSPDGRYVALVIEQPDTASSDIWIHDLERDVRTRATFGTQDETGPVWSPGGDRIAFIESHDLVRSLVVQSVGGGENPSVLLEGSQGINVTDWSYDGSLIVYQAVPEKGAQHTDIFAISADGSGEPISVLSGPFSESGALLSSDGRWMIYNSDESGRPETYLTAFPKPGRKWQISTEGSFGTMFSQDDSAIMTFGLDLEVRRVPVDLSAAAPRIGRSEHFTQIPPVATNGDIAPDLSRAILVVEPELTREIPITLVQNWTR